MALHTEGWVWSNLILKFIDLFLSRMYYEVMRVWEGRV
jgi:hypothetical protein